MSVLRPPWEAEGHSKADFDPAWTGYFDRDGAQAIGELWRYVLRTGAAGGAPGFQAWEYVKPHGPLYHEVKLPGCDGETALIPSAAGAVAFAPGQIVSVAVSRQGAVILGRPPGGLLGASGFAVDDVDGGAFDELTIRSVSPATITAGVTDQLLTVSGLGFRETPVDVLFAAYFDDDEASSTFGQYLPDPYVTLHDLTWVSRNQVTILADAAAGTPDNYAFGVRGERAA